LVDAKEMLRRYLEQRRELGESEFVLDGLQVDDVMRMIGATGSRVETVIPASSISVAALPALGPPRDSELDWRTSLREAGVNVDAANAQALEAAKSARDGPTVSSQTTENMAFKKGIVAPDDAERMPSIIEKLQSLDEIAAKVNKCTRCPLYETATQGVPGEGDPNAQLVCVGEAPGAKEDETGRPFVGQAGQLLTKILAAIDLTREQVFIVNVLKHRPPGNRNPRPEEVEACSPYLIRQLELIKPRVIVAFGTFAAQTLLQTKTPIGQLRGLVHRYHGIPLIVTYHPAALLRNPAWKRPTWEDVKLARRILDSSSAT
jgi:uracil-DNA glycosylase family 4